MQKPVREISQHEAPDRIKAIGLMIAAVSLFSCLDTTAKYLYSVVQLPLSQIVWMRFAGQFAAMIIVLGAVSLPRLLQTRKLGYQVLRSLLLLGATLFNFQALRFLQLDQAATIMFLVPLTVALLAGPLLGEWVGWRRLAAIFVGFLGILVVMRPGYGGFHPAMAYSLAAMLSVSLFGLATRYLASYDRAENTLFYSMFAGIVLVGPLAFMEWTWPRDGFAWLLMLSLGLWAGLGHYLFILAHRWAPASSIAPFIYVQLVVVSVLGFAIFGDLPDLWTLAGSAIIVASGIYLLHRERVTGRAAVATEAQDGSAS